MTATHPVDTGARRVESVAKLTGAARYAADHHPDGVLHAVLVGAPVAAGRVRSVDVATARVLPGVVAVLTGTDLPDFPELRGPLTQVLTAQDVRQVLAPLLGAAASDVTPARPAEYAVSHS